MNTLYPGRQGLLQRAGITLLLALVATVSLCRAQVPGAEPGASDLRQQLQFPLLFVKRFNYQGLHIYDTFYQWRPGGGIYILENPADPPARHRVRAVIDPSTPGTLGAGIYFDPCLSYDAKRLLFSYKGAAGGSSTIYEINVDGTGLRRVIPDTAPSAAYRGSGTGHHDVTPCYLPDGRIVFTSTRYSGLVPCANNGVAILHVMNADGTGIQAISVNNVTEFDPVVLPDGRVMFGRWEYVDRNALVIQSLWTVTPDGRNEMEMFGNNMVFPEALLQAKPVPGHPGFVVATFAPHNAPPRGTIAMVDTRGDKNDPKAIFNFESPTHPTHDRGHSRDAWALSQDVVIFSGAPRDPNAPRTAVRAAGSRRRNNPVLNALLIMDRSGKPFVVHSDPTIDLHNPIPIIPRPEPVRIVDFVDRRVMTGKFMVDDVYVSMPEVPRGSVKWLRVLEETSRVTPTPGGNSLNQTFSISAAKAWSAKIYHGIVPVEPDGSVFFEAPSGRALFFQLLDADYKLVRGMRTFIQAAPGTTRSCVGCHEYNPRPAGMAVRRTSRPLRRLQPEAWGSGYLDFTTHVQPVLDARCVSCHGGELGMAKGLDLSRGWTAQFNIAYENLAARRTRLYEADVIGGICAMNGTAYWSCKVFGSYSHGSGKALLADVLLDERHRGMLTNTERELIFAWMDSNGIYFGTWDYTDAGALSKPYQDAVAAIKTAMKDADCVSCHANNQGKIARFDHWINLDRPEMSRVLRAPLPASATAAGGYGLALCRNRNVDHNVSRRGLLFKIPYQHAVRNLDFFPTQTWPDVWPPEGEALTPFASTQDAHYQNMLTIIRQAREAQLAVPRIDMPGAAWAGNGIREGRSRQMLPTPLPEPLPPIRAQRHENGMVRIVWEDSARTIGLTVEVHRSAEPGFAPSEATRLGKSVRASFLDRTPAEGAVEYAVIYDTSLGTGMECGVVEGCSVRSRPVRVTLERE